METLLGLGKSDLEKIDSNEIIIKLILLRNENICKGLIFQLDIRI